MFSLNRNSYEKVDESLSGNVDVESVEDDSDNDSENNDQKLLSQSQEDKIYFQKKLLYQQRALIRKTITLQWRQKWTNVCQLLSPIIGMLIIVIFKELGVSSLLTFADKPINVPFPQLFGLNMKTVAALTGGMLDISTCNQWYMFDFEDTLNSKDREFFGYNMGQPWLQDDSSGMLSNIANYHCRDIQKNAPYFVEFKQHDNQSHLYDYLYNVLSQFSDTVIELDNKNQEFQKLNDLPDGAFIIRQANKKSLQYNMQINDSKYWQYHRNNGVTKIGFKNLQYSNETLYSIRSIDGALTIADIMNQAYMREIFNETTVIGGVSFFPFFTDVENSVQRIISIICTLVLPLCMSMGLPVFIYQIVLEKETKLIENMKINGMKMQNYWLVNYVFNFVFYSATAVLFLIFGIMIFEISVFTETNTMILLITYLGWGLSQISMAFFISVFLSKSQTASIVGYTVAVWLTTVASTFNLTIYSTPNKLEWMFHMLPQFSFSRMIYFISIRCGYDHCLKSFSEFNQEMFTSVVMLFVQAIVYMILALYLYQVVPQTHGVPKKWNYIFNKNSKVNSQTENQDQQQQADFDKRLEDGDSQAERTYVHNIPASEYLNYPLIIKDIRKVYPQCGGVPPKVATKCFSLRIKKGEMFGLLGPNGAGKTTLISMLTGMYGPTSGNAWIAGYNLKTQLDIVQLQIGLCPQFDLLWGDLTVEEHLLFFARLKGVEPDEEYFRVSNAISEVMLDKYRDFQVKTLSGGMKRRLSVAISLVSDPKIIFLDEPSTGLDPENRRQLWDILSCQKGKRAVILTTHSMEEADVLCSRIGIVSDGILRCVAPQVRLKSLYGGGYHLFINCQKGKALQIIRKINRGKQRQIDKDRAAKEKLIMSGIIDKIAAIDFQEEETIQDAMEDDDGPSIVNRLAEFIQREIPNSTLIREFNGNFVYQIPIESFKAEKLYLTIERNKERLKITDWGLSQCSLEDVFSKICEPPKQ